MIFDLLTADKEIGCVISGPLRDVLLKSGNGWHATAAYETEYGLLIVFTGITALLRGVAGVKKRLKMY